MAITIYDLKPRFRSLLRPLVGRLAAEGITANQLTVAAALGSVALGIVSGSALRTGSSFSFCRRSRRSSHAAS